MDRESLLWWLPVALEVPVNPGLHSSLFQRQCEYKLQLFVVLSVCLIMMPITTPRISHVTRGKRINLVGSARERHFSLQYDLFI